MQSNGKPAHVTALETEFERVKSELQEVDDRRGELVQEHDRLQKALEVLKGKVQVTKRRKAVNGTGVTVKEIVSAYAELKPELGDSPIDKVETAVRNLLRERGRKLQGFGNRWPSAVKQLGLSLDSATA